jgi:hypothetical protein
LSLGAVPQQKVPSSVPFLSIVLTGRNDEYGVDFRTRFLRTLAFNTRELADRGVAFEVVFVEWAPDPERPLLVDLVLDTIPALGDNRSFRGIVVDPAYQDALSLNPQLEFLEFLAKNVGIRRATGEYVLTTNCDVFLSRAVVDVLQQGRLEPRVLYRAVRHDVKIAVDSSVVGWEMLEDPRNLEHPPRTLAPPFMGGGTGDFLLLDRASLHALRGFNEVYRVARIGIDHNFLVKVLSDGLTIRDIGGPVYHLNHLGSYRITRHVYNGREGAAPYGDIRWPSRGVIYANPPTWGLANAPEMEQSGHKSLLRFSWDAVPPLVDLRGVVLPVARTGGPYPGSFAEP